MTEKLEIDLRANALTSLPPSLREDPRLIQAIENAKDIHSTNSAENTEAAIQYLKESASRILATRSCISAAKQLLIAEAQEFSIQLDTEIVEIKLGEQHSD